MAVDRCHVVQAEEIGLGERSDIVTVVGISLLAYALSNVLHEGVGHGGACLLVGGVPQSLSSMAFECGLGQGGPWARRLVAAGGTLVNLAAAGLGFALLRHRRRKSAQVQYFVWLFATVNLLQGTGYFLFSGVGDVGDWAAFINGMGARTMWRVGLILLGAVTYYLGVRLALAQLTPFIGGKAPMRYRRANTLMLTPYLSGGALYIGAGTLNPAGPMLIALSAAASSLGGTSGLAWGQQLLR